jgi:hypothetical protein
MSLKGLFFPLLKSEESNLPFKAGDLSVFIPECYWYAKLFLSVHFTFPSQMTINLQHLSRRLGLLTFAQALSDPQRGSVGIRVPLKL